MGRALSLDNVVERMGQAPSTERLRTYMYFQLGFGRGGGLFFFKYSPMDPSGDEMEFRKESMKNSPRKNPEDGRVVREENDSFI